MIAAIAIGRNEGARLVRCLDSLQGQGNQAQGNQAQVGRIVYVDSGSTDGSVEMARARGVEVVELDMTKPFTAARSRNAGLDRLRQGERPEFVQLVDGDCEVRPDWIGKAAAFLRENPKVAVVCGRRRERFPEASVYNAQCDREWDTPVGEARACGGDALMRMEALDQVGGYDPRLIAGEEPEMCVRLRQKGWKIWRLDAEMTLHDAAMTRFGQFWKRARRAGHAYAEGAWLHGAPPERHNVAQVKRAVLWGIVLPVAIVVLALIVSPWLLALFAIYPVQIARLARRGGNNRAAWENATLLTLAKFAEALGIAEFHLRRLTGKRAGLIEYK
ncbi:glycosyltransferase [Paenirhodobacter populi]|uniref:Glycosyltransferase family 2 protein n=1 Tax=Paenirhodobacter populi TaxID=2306993 RepID=A0A443JBY9_9RHOB|nr:glycosyltransferase [Sinirhodobacter populi]RWR18041.1 glycosyltransferase family 2 protein [Sinirhodobacter populi]